MALDRPIDSAPTATDREERAAYLATDDDDGGVAE